MVWYYLVRLIQISLYRWKTCPLNAASVGTTVLLTLIVGVVQMTQLDILEDTVFTFPLQK